MSERFTVIGLSDSREPEFPARVVEALAAHRVFAGGARHRTIVERFLPEGARWITIAPPLGGVLDRFREESGPVLVFTSGDPLFYGFGATLQRAFPGASFSYFPSFHSLQRLAHRCGLPYQGMRPASLTGRSWHELDRALIDGAGLIGVLTDRKKDPAAIAARLLDYGYGAYGMVVGEALGGPEERVRTMTPAEAAASSFHELNCVLLRATAPAGRLFGIPEAAFEGLPGRPNMITKMPVRLATLSRLDLRNARNFWDIGFCTGSVSIEAKHLAPDLEITAFERRPECDGIFERNCRTFRAPGIRKVMGDFLGQDHRAFAGADGTVDAMFIGGHGGRLQEFFAVLDPLLAPGGRIVVNAVQPATLADFREMASMYRYRMPDDIVLTSGDHHTITIAAAEKER